MPTWLSLPLLHAGSPEPTGWLHSNWRPEPSVVIGVLALIGLYVIWTGSRNQDQSGRQINPVSAGQRLAFITGALTIGVALGPPLDDWSDHYLLTAHMAQHLLLMMVAVPLLIGGTPGWLVSKLLNRGPIRPIMYALTRPVVVHLHTDSTYVRSGITQWVAGWERNGWRTASKQPVKNVDLWQRLKAACEGHEVEWFWVKGHAGVPDNELADQLATKGMLAAMGR